MMALSVCCMPDALTAAHSHTCRDSCGTQQAGFAAYSASPPTWPERFHVTFQEYTHDLVPWHNGSYNKGSFHYDHKQTRQLWSHGDGQTNNWCQCAGLQTSALCNLHSLERNGTGGMFAVFPTLNHCCMIGDFAHGFGPIRPDWLVRTNATFGGNQTVGGRNCPMWRSHHPGDWFMMKSDDWSQDDDGVPCVYEDHFRDVPHALGMKHTLTFDSTTYFTEAEADSIFDIPVGILCDKTCPNKEKWCQA